MFVYSDIRESKQVVVLNLADSGISQKHCDQIDKPQIGRLSDIVVEWVTSVASMVL